MKSGTAISSYVRGNMVQTTGSPNTTYQRDSAARLITATLGSSTSSYRYGASALDYVFKDGLGSVRALVDANGNLVSFEGSAQQFNYAAFGKLVNQPSTLTASYLYAGEGVKFVGGEFGIIRTLRRAGGGKLLIAGKRGFGDANPGKILPPPP